VGDGILAGEVEGIRPEIGREDPHGVRQRDAPAAQLDRDADRDRPAARADVDDPDRLVREHPPWRA
jgi:hypothetical protein